MALFVETMHLRRNTPFETYIEVNSIGQAIGVTGETVQDLIAFGIIGGQPFGKELVILLLDIAIRLFVRVILPQLIHPCTYDDERMINHTLTQCTLNRYYLIR